MTRMQTVKFSLFALAMLGLANAYAAGHAAAPAATSATPALSAESQTPPAVKVSNGMLTDKNGMTLYTFDKDVAGNGKSACNGDCLAKWPALIAADVARNVGDFSVVARDDGRKQWAYKGKPLYLWIGDTKAGDSTGNGVSGVWHKATK